MTGQREGPQRIVLYRCDGCKHLRLDHYAWNVHACRLGPDVGRIEPSTDTPTWCPLLPKEKTE